MSKARNIAALSTVEVGATADQTKADLNAIGVSGGRKNLIINGAMQVSQRGAYTSATSLTTSSVYYLDRFKSKCDGVTGTLTHKVDQSVNGKITDTVLLSSTSTATGRLETLQMIEDLQQFKGQVTTFSAWVKSNNGNARVIMHTDGSNVQTSSNSHTGGGAWELLKGTVTNATNITNMNLYCGIQAAGTGNIAGVASGDYFEIAFLQTELGSVATDFEHRSYGEELALCQRYYSKNARAIGVWQSTAHFRVVGQFATTMRATPSVSRTDSAGYHENWHIQGFNGFTINTIYGDNKGFDVYCNSTSGSSTAREMAMMSKDTIQFDAEL